MKKKIKRQLKRLRRLQHEMLARENTIMHSVIRLLEEPYDDPDDEALVGGYEVFAKPEPDKPKLKVVGDG